MAETCRLRTLWETTQIKRSLHSVTIRKEYTMSMNELFERTTNTNTVGTRGLAGTAELTRLSEGIANNILKAMEADIETYRPRIQQSSVDSKALDVLIDELGEINPDDANFLMELDEHTIEGMLKSQQSKRSRSKSKVMTIDNYKTMMTAAIAENIIRTVIGKPKTSGGARTGGMVDYTGAQLEALAADQVALKKEIRNIQSKKSIMKSKADFSESDERWIALLKAEQQLKDLRVGATPQVVEVDTTKNRLAEMLAETDIEKLKSAEAHELLEAIRNMVVADEE